MNQRIAAVLGLFEFAVITGTRDDCPVPAARRSSGARAKRRGLLDHISPGRPGTGERLVRETRRLPESLEADDVDEFFADLLTYRGRAIMLAMLLGGLRAGEVRPHPLRHTYGTDLAGAGMDLLVLRELMGHTSPEITAGYVHVSPARAIRFLDQFDDLDAWMSRPTRARLNDTKRTDAWPFVSWCFAIGRLRADVDLIAARGNGCHYSTWARLHPDDIERAVTAGTELGWGNNWSKQVGVLALAFICLTSDCAPEGLDADAFQATAVDLDASVSVTSNHRKIMPSGFARCSRCASNSGSARRRRNVRERSLADQLAKIPNSRSVGSCSATSRPAPQPCGPPRSRTAATTSRSSACGFTTINPALLDSISSTDR